MFARTLHGCLPYCIRRHFSHKQTFQFFLYLCLAGAVFLMFQLLLFVYMKENEHYHNVLLKRAHSLLKKEGEAKKGSVANVGGGRRRQVGGAIMGVNPGDALRYAPDERDMFSCLSRLEVKIPFDRVSSELGLNLARFFDPVC